MNAILPVLDRTKWVEWPSLEQIVEVKMRDGTTHIAEAFKINWAYDAITAFRVLDVTELKVKP